VRDRDSAISPVEEHSERSAAEATQDNPTPSGANALEIAFGSLDDPDGVDADEDGGDAGHDAERKDAEQAEDQGFPGAVIGGPRVELGIGRRRQTG
jgi:hypothetical protein